MNDSMIQHCMECGPESPKCSFCNDRWPMEIFLLCSNNGVMSFNRGRHRPEGHKFVTLGLDRFSFMENEEVFLPNDYQCKCGFCLDMRRKGGE